MLKTATNLFLVASILGFIVFYGKLSCVFIMIIVLFWTAILGSEVFSYTFFYKIALNKALFRQNSFFNILFSRKFLPTILSTISGAILAICFILNILLIDAYGLLFIAFAIVGIFLIIRFAGFKILKSEFKNVYLGSKKWVIFLSATLSAIVWGIFVLIFDKNQLNNTMLFEYLNSQNISSNLQCLFLNEAYAYSSYMNSLAQWLKSSILSGQSVIVFLFVAVNKFIFFVACVHFISFFFSLNFGGKRVKIGYFLATIFTLCYITFVLITASNLHRYVSKTTETKIEKTVKFILKNGITFDINATDAQLFLTQLSDIKELNLVKLQTKTDAYIDKVYDEGAKSVAQKVAQWNYSAMFDYVVLWHKIFNDGMQAYIDEKFKEFIDESFPTNFNEELTKIVMNGVGEYEKDVKNIFKHYVADGNLSFDLNITSDFSQSDRLNRLSISGVGAVSMGAAVMAKIAGKTATKTTAKLAASSTSATSGVICGAAAVVCAPAFAVATWFGFDYIIAKGDEFMNRDELERKIYDDLMQSKDEFKKSFNVELNILFQEISSSNLLKE